MRPSLGCPVRALIMALDSCANLTCTAQPHASVSDSSFYKHIDCELPEPERLRQLLVWAAGRAVRRLSSPSSSSPSTEPSHLAINKSSGGHGKDPPVLSDDQKEVVRVVQEDFIRMLAEKKINLSVYTRDRTPSGSRLRPNEQNVKNQARQVTFQQHIDRYVQCILIAHDSFIVMIRAQAEAEAWKQVDGFYHAFEMESRAELEQRRESHKSISAKVRGKQRATSQEPSDDWSWLLPGDDELSDDFKLKVDLALIKSVMASDSRTEEDSLDKALADLPYNLDILRSYVNSAVQMTNIVEAELDHHSLLLSHALRSGSLSLSDTSTGVLMHLPLVRRGVSHIPGESPRDIFRALSRIDKERPPGEIGDAVRRAVREVQRVQEGAMAGAGERRLTGLPPGVGATPRKVPGTPRRR